jgi:hypothetical protein
MKVKIINFRTLFKALFLFKLRRLDSASVLKYEAFSAGPNNVDMLSLYLRTPEPT